MQPIPMHPVNSRARILIVDDEPAVRLTLEMALADTPHHVESVDTAERALRSVNQRAPDLLLVDKNLPGMSGVELIRRVREEGSDVVCAMITGYPSAESAMEVLQLGVRGYLEKPFDDIYAVVKRIDGLLAARRSSAALREATRNLQHLTFTLNSPRGLTVFAVTPYTEERGWLVRCTGEKTDRIESIASGSEALQRMLKEVPDLVVVDSGTRDPDVFAFIETARALGPEMQFAVVCMAPSLALLTQLIDAGVAAVLERPLTETLYRTRLDPVLRRLRLRSRRGQGDDTHR